MSERRIPVTNEIEAFFHCTKCLQEVPPGQSPRDFIHVEVGWTDIGLQVWCVRHELNVVHVDFCGQGVRINTAGKEE